MAQRNPPPRGTVLFESQPWMARLRAPEAEERSSFSRGATRLFDERAVDGRCLDSWRVLFTFFPFFPSFFFAIAPR